MAAKGAAGASPGTHGPLGRPAGQGDPRGQVQAAAQTGGHVTRLHGPDQLEVCGAAAEGKNALVVMSWGCSAWL